MIVGCISLEVAGTVTPDDSVCILKCLLYEVFLLI